MLTYTYTFGVISVIKNGSAFWEDDFVKYVLYGLLKCLLFLLQYKVIIIVSLLY